MATYRDLMALIKEHQYAYVEEDETGVYFTCKCGALICQDPEEETNKDEWHAGHLAVEIEDALELDLQP